MGGKIHGDYQRYIYAQPGGTPVAPGTRRQMTYTEGYVARRNGALVTTNPHTGIPARSVELAEWDKGWSDANNLYPPTHVGGPTPT